MVRIYDPAFVPHLEFTELTDNLIRTRGNKFKLVHHHITVINIYDLRKYNFTNRVIPIWNSFLIMSFLLKLLNKPSKTV